MATGNKILSGLAIERLAAQGLGPRCNFVHIQALSTNLGTIVIGDDDDVVALPVASRKGVALGAGQMWAGTCTDLYNIRIIGAVVGDGLSWWSKAD